jgi:hypothetical protein
MQVRQVRSLIVKDFRIHGRGIILAEFGFLAFIFLVSHFVARTQGSFSSAACAVLIFNTNFLSASFIWGDWLISREKTKSTFAWLRSMPLSDQSIVRSKLLLGLLCTFSLWIASSFLFSWQYFFPSRWKVWLVVLLCLSCFTVLSFGTRWILTQKIGTLLPIGIVVAIVVIPLAGPYIGIDLGLRMKLLWSQGGVELLTALALCVICLLLWMGLERWVMSFDTYKFLE